MALAQRLGVPFADADDLHPAANIAKMAAGHPLDDADRRPWLESVGNWLAAHPEGSVVACSALQRSYRNLLRRHCPQLWFVHLSGSFELIARRMSGRHGHFMPAELLQSQFDALQPLTAEECGITLDIDRPIDQLVGQCLSALDHLGTAG